MFSKEVYDVYIHRGKQAVLQTTYLKECINKGLFPFIEKYHHNGNYLFWPDLASAHYSNLVKERLHEKNVPLVARQDNPPNVPQARSIETVWALLERKARSIETVWALLERKVYENNWEAKTFGCISSTDQTEGKRI
ncbi:unnamed protein product [Rotaria magnacalcarata]